MARYQYDPRQEYNPEDFPPPPPGYGEKGGPTTLEEYKQEQDAVPLPQNPDGSTTYPQKFGPEPPIFYATNVGDTAQKWGKEGKNYTFLAESPQAMQTAKEVGAPRVVRGYDPALDQAKPVAPQGVGPEPAPGELDNFAKAQGFWKHVVDSEHGGVDPTKINSAEVAMNKRAELRKKYDLELFNRGAGSKEYKEIEKHIDEQVKDAENIAERQRAGAAEKMKEVFSFAKAKFGEERKISGEERRQKGLDTLANVDKAQKYTQAEMEGPNAPWNYDLTSDELKAAIKDPTLPLTGKRLKPMVLTNINRMRDRAGMPPIVEKDLPASKEYLDWGLFKTGEKTTRNYGYEEGRAPAGRSAAIPRGTASPQIVRTGTHNGRRVVQYSDGRTEYAR